MTVRIAREGPVLHVTLDAPPVNAIGQAMRAGLLDAVRVAEAEGAARVIVSGAGRAFAAGADAREFDGPPVAPHLPEVLDAIERSPVPWIAAIDGVALGGGAEIALACRMRIAAPGARIGFPEVTLGVIPGAGGTQRLPRLVGLDRALAMVSLGRPVGAADAEAAGLVHAVADDPVRAAAEIEAAALAARPPTSALPPPAPDAAALTEARATVAAKMRGQIAPVRAIDAVEAGLSVPFAEAMAVERAAFLDLRASAQAEALRHLFFAERAAKAPPGLPDPAPLEHVAVVGGGTMGAGIATALLAADLRVTLVEADAEAAARAEANVAETVAGAARRGKIAADAARRLTVTTDMGDAAGATLAIEAAFESLDVKTRIFAALDGALPDAVLATNTSYLDPDRIAEAVADPSRVIGLHFFAPAHVMRLLEVVRARATGDRARATAFALARRLGKVPVEVGVCDGFVGNRILLAYRSAAERVLLRGATPWAVDGAMEAFGYAMGPFAAQDLSGLDIAAAARAMRADPAPAPVFERLLDAGRLGRKAGAGWHRYPEGVRTEDPAVAEIAAEAARAAGVARADLGPDAIAEALVLAMVNEAAAILREGVARTAADVDLVTVLGYGFPRWRGGLMHHAEALGAARVVERLRALADEDPSYDPDPLLLERARGG